MERRDHRSAAGRRDFLLSLPQHGRPQGLIVMLHGCKQDAEDFARGTGMAAHAAAAGWATAWPEQGVTDNSKGCWNWFRPEHQKRGFGEPAIVAGIAEDLILEHRIPRHAVAVAGFSAGAAMALILRDTYPDVFRAAVAHSGVAPGLATNAIAALSAMNGGGSEELEKGPSGPPLLIVQGSDDTVVDPRNADRIAHTTAPSELRLIAGLGHAWSGGSPEGSFTDPDFPDISEEIVDFVTRSTSTMSRISQIVAGRVAS